MAFGGWDYVPKAYNSKDLTRWRDVGCGMADVGCGCRMSDYGLETITINPITINHIRLRIKDCRKHRGIINSSTYQPIN